MDSSRSESIPAIDVPKITPQSITQLSGVISRVISSNTRFDLPINAKTAIIIAQRGTILSVGAISVDGVQGSGFTDDTMGGAGGSSTTLAISGLGMTAELRERALIVTVSTSTTIIIHYHA